jgi:hypothetical protein
MYEAERSRGWTLFATIAIGVAGCWNLIIGIAAFAKKEYFDTGSLLYENLSFWGFVWIVVALLQLLTAFLLARRITAGKALGLIGVSLSMLIWFFSIRAHPTASVLIIVLDGLILYALTAEPSYDGPIPADARIEGMAPGQQGQRFA